MQPKPASVFLLFLITAITSFAQTKQSSYQASWKKIDSLIEKTGQVKTALTEVNALYARAKQDSNDAELVRALIYRAKLTEQTTDNGNQQTIYPPLSALGDTSSGSKTGMFPSLEREIAEARQPARSILQSILASAYKNYLDQNRYKFSGRSNTANFVKDDPATWTIDDLKNKISSLYSASISDSLLLQHTDIQSYDAVIIKGNMRRLRPTLFDLLAHRAIDYFKNDERNISKPAYAYEINDSAAFDDAAAFARYRFQSADSTSNLYRALLLFQQLIGFHLRDSNSDALNDVDLERLEFVRKNITIESKDVNYEKALQRIIDKYPLNTVTAKAFFLLADTYSARADTYRPLEDTTHRFDRLRAEELCKKALTVKDSSEGRANCANLLNAINRQELTTEMELVNLPAQPLRMLLSYRNVTTLFFRIIKLNRQLKEKMGNNTWDDDFWKRLTALDPAVSFPGTVPDTKDHQRHSVEIKIDPLNTGEYALIASVDKDFSLKQNVMSLQYFYVSSISYVNRDSDYYALDRQTGKPLAGARIQLWRQEYSSRDRIRLYRDQKYTADSHGYFRLRDSISQESNTTKFIDIKYGNDELFIDEPAFQYSYYSDKDEREDDADSLAYFFTDRSIYRPGQTVYFKCIAFIKKKEANASVLRGQSMRIKLTNANGQEIDSVSIKTNDLGSCAGKFVLPKGQLNGRFYIGEERMDGQADFTVEEYKRPKFSVEIESPHDTYRLGDTVTLQGTAIVYAGNNINGAAVSYRVIRKMNIPYFSDDVKIWPPYRSGSMEIAHGTLSTDANGKFMISFRALPDRAIPASQNPLFTYEISADVTDINGETRTGIGTIELGYQGVRIILSQLEIMHADSLRNLQVAVTDMNGQAVKSAVNIKIEKLKAPEKIFRRRYWQQPDQFVMSKDEYSKNFPLDLYSDENNKAKWPADKKMFEGVVITKADSSGPRDISGWNVPASDTIDLKGTKFDAGWYAVKAFTQDRFGNHVEATRFVQLYSERMVSSEAGAVIETNRKIGAPGDPVSCRLVTNLTDINPVQQVTTSSGEKTITGTATNNFSIAPRDAGSVVINVFFVKDNRVYTKQQVISIAAPERELKIDYTTFRDKTLPGAHEKWKVKISGYKAGALTAELLTTMYDASLDQFAPHVWTTPPAWTDDVNATPWSGEAGFKNISSNEKRFETIVYASYRKEYDELLSFNGSTALQGRVRGIALNRVAGEASLNDVVVTAYGVSKVKNAKSLNVPEKEENANAPEGQTPVISPRSNLNETAFFFPDLRTDSSGNIEFSFTTPEALTTWKWMLLAHTKDLAFGYGEKTMITQKELMVQPNLPRFLRQGDKIDLSAKVVNMTANKLSGTASLQLTDALTGKDLTQLGSNASSSFSAGATQSAAVNFQVNIPKDFVDPVNVRIVASSGSLSDGEESVLPVLSNSVLVTESLPLPMKGNGTKNFNFDKLLASGNSASLKQNGITVEYTSNPAWYVVQALPYLSEVGKENAEQLFSRFYAHALASKIAGSSPRFHEIVNKWNTSDTSALLSNLEKNEELKSVLLNETPWVLQAKTETQQKKNIALLFDMNRMSSELSAALGELKAMQSPAGGFVWCKGGPEDRYMTQYILTGLGRLKKLGALPADPGVQGIITPAVSYLDHQVKKDYEELKKLNKKLPVASLDNITAQYLYMRSFFTDISVPGDVFTAYNYFRNQSKQAWVKQNSFTRGMIALSLFRTGDIANAQKITRALKESSITNEEMGTYWKDMNGGFYWYEAPVETQALLIEAIAEINSDTLMINSMKTWLLKNKQTNSWRSSKATADACYAFLLQGSDWTSSDAVATITLGNKNISSSKAEAGTGYFKEFIPADEVKPSMGNVTVKIENKVSAPSWGSVYWQYFEGLDKITNSTTPLQLNKKLFIERNSDKGPVLEPLKDNTVHVGDRVRVRIELRADRTMEYVHMKDMRASCMEPVNVISQYKWQDGLGYYETSKDASTDFFFGSLPKGVYVFEYSLYVSATGSFSNGITTIQCMYAPEFSSHSEGIKLQSESK